MDMKDIFNVTAVVSCLVPAVVLVAAGIKKVIEKNCWLPTGLFCLFAVPSVLALIPTVSTLFTTTSLSEGHDTLFFSVIFGSMLLGAVVGLLLCWLLMRLTRKRV